MKCFDPSIDKWISLGGQQYLLNERNYLKDFTGWDEQIRDWLATEEQIVLGPEHLGAIAFLRASFEEHRKHPMIRMVTAEIARLFGAGKGTIQYFHRLFPGGIHQAFLIAGLPMQDSCC